MPSLAQRLPHGTQATQSIEPSWLQTS